MTWTSDNSKARAHDGSGAVSFLPLRLLTSQRMAIQLQRGGRGPKARPEDVPLHEDVRWLAGALGRVIQRLEGQEAFEIVEKLRVATRARRHGDRDAASLENLLRQVGALSVEQCAMAARAF